MKVLIITYYWPPAGGSGVQRWLKFAKYLRDFGIEPIIYTVDNGNYPKEDLSLLDDIPANIEVLKQPIWEPTNVLFWKKKKEQKKDVSNAINSPILSFIRGNFFIPDPKMFWVKRSVSFLENYLHQHKIDAVISTGPPHSMHLIGKKLQQKTGVTWLADFRDPWSNIYYHKDFYQLSFAKIRNKQLEKSVLKNADCIITVSNALKNEFSKTAKRVEVITNGFDANISTGNVELDNKFSISYIGLLPKQSNPKLLFKVLHQLKEESVDFKNDLKLIFIGDISEEVFSEITHHQLTENTQFLNYVPHQKAIEFQRKSQVLLLLIPNVSNSEGILTGKLFEYLVAKRPILAISPSKGDLDDIIEKTNSGVVLQYTDEQQLRKTILDFYEKFKKRSLKVASKNLDQYHRKELTKQLSIIIKSLFS